MTDEQLLVDVLVVFNNGHSLELEGVAPVDASDDQAWAWADGGTLYVVPRVAVQHMVQSDAVE